MGRVSGCYRRFLWVLSRTCASISVKVLLLSRRRSGLGWHGLGVRRHRSRLRCTASMLLPASGSGCSSKGGQVIEWTQQVRFAVAAVEGDECVAGLVELLFELLGQHQAAKQCSVMARALACWRSSLSNSLRISSPAGEGFTDGELTSAGTGGLERRRGRMPCGRAGAHRSW